MHERIEALEYEVSMLHDLVRSYRKTITILLVLTILCITTNVLQRFFLSQAITTKMVRVIDDRGNTMVLISSDERGGCVFIMNGTGKLVAWVSASERGGDFSALNNNGKITASMWVDYNGNGVLSIFNAYGQMIYTVP